MMLDDTDVLRNDDARRIGKLSRRDMLALMGLFVGAFALAAPRRAWAAAAATARTASAGIAPTALAAKEFTPNAFVSIGRDGLVHVVCKHLEMGQGVATGLATLVAEELDADWQQVRVWLAPADIEHFSNPMLSSPESPLQATGGSSSIANSFVLMREAGAKARAVLLQAAATAWAVPAQALRTERGQIVHAASGRRSGFGEFVDAAAKLAPPSTVMLKSPSQFRLIGVEGATPRLDIDDKTNGRAIFSLDIDEGEPLVALLLRSPRFGGKLKSFDAAKAREVRDVVDVREVPGGVAVYAKSTYPAIKARRLVQATWDDSEAESRGNEELYAEFVGALDDEGLDVGSRGDPARVSGPGQRVQAQVLFPYLAHAPMEPLNGWMLWDGHSVRCRFAAQQPTTDLIEIGKIFGVPPSAVSQTVVMAGGSFGRRIDTGGDMVGELAQVCKAMGPGRPIKLVWTREDDIQGGFYRPMVAHRWQAVIESRKIVALEAHVSTQMPLPLPITDPGGKVTPAAVELMAAGMEDLPYDVPNVRCVLHPVTNRIPVATLRSVANMHTGYVTETFFDHCFELIGDDPVAARLRLFAGKDAPRLSQVTQLVAEMADWRGGQPRQGRAMGVAVVKSFGTYVAQIAEVSLGKGGEPVVHRVWCTVDCGQVVNPDIVRQQMEGSIGFGLGVAMYGEIKFDKGVRISRNFFDYRSLRIHEMPTVSVRLVRSDAPPSGVGEPGVPPIAPAVANALARLGKARPLRLPFVQGV